jgi:hypothetical protein
VIGVSAVPDVPLAPPALPGQIGPGGTWTLTFQPPSYVCIHRVTVPRQLGQFFQMTSATSGWNCDIIFGSPFLDDFASDICHDNLLRISTVSPSVPLILKGTNIDTAAAPAGNHPLIFNFWVSQRPDPADLLFGGGDCNTFGCCP